MAIRVFTYLVLALGCACAALENEAVKSVVGAELNKDDLKTDASTYDRRYSSDWSNYPGTSGYSGYGITGHGIIDNRYNSYYGGGYDNSYGYNGYSGGYNGYSGTGYGGNTGSSFNDYNSYNGYKGYGGYGLSNYGGNGGYGGYGGNGGLISYYGYNNPYNQGAYHLGYGYYNKKPGNIYNSGITPNLITGYRGYSRR